MSIKLVMGGKEVILDPRQNLFGYIHSYTKVLSERSSGGEGGYVWVEVIAVHAHECSNWRTGKRHGPCTCGAEKEWERLVGEVEGVNPEEED